MCVIFKCVFLSYQNVVKQSSFRLFVPESRKMNVIVCVWQTKAIMQSLKLLHVSVY